MGLIYSLTKYKTNRFIACNATVVNAAKAYVMPLLYLIQYIWKW